MTKLNIKNTLTDEELAKTHGGLEPFTVAMIALGAGLLIGGIIGWWSRRKARRA